MAKTEKAAQKKTGASSTSRYKEDEAVIALLKTMDHINRITSKTMEPFGVTSAQYNVLRILRGASPEGLPTLELADRMVVHSPGITRMIDRLEKKNLVARIRSKEDRRVVHCLITQKGLELVNKMDRPVAKMNKKIVRNLNQQQLAELVVLLDQMRA